MNNYRLFSSTKFRKKRKLPSPAPTIEPPCLQGFLDLLFTGQLAVLAYLLFSVTIFGLSIFGLSILSLSILSLTILGLILCFRIFLGVVADIKACSAMAIHHGFQKSQQNLFMTSVGCVEIPCFLCHLDIAPGCMVKYHLAQKWVPTRGFQSEAQNESQII